MLLIEEVANILRCSTQDVQAEIESGKLKAFQVSGQLRVLESELQRLVSGTPSVHAQEPSSEQKGVGMSPTVTADAATGKHLAIQFESMPTLPTSGPTGSPTNISPP